MKKLVFAMLVAAASAAFADGDDNIAVLVSTTGPDCYLGGEVVMDGECYALVWSKDGVFEGFTADGAPIDTNDCVVSVGSVARAGRCKAAFEVSASLAAELENGVYAVYILDTRVTDGGETKPRGLVNGKLAALNGYGEVAEGVTVSVRSGVAVANETETQPKAGLRASGGKRVRTTAGPAPDVQQPKIKRIAFEDGGMALYWEAENADGDGECFCCRLYPDGTTGPVFPSDSGSGRRLWVEKDKYMLFNGQEAYFSPAGIRRLSDGTLLLADVRASSGQKIKSIADRPDSYSYGTDHGIAASKDGQSICMYSPYSGSTTTYPVLILPSDLDTLVQKGKRRIGKADGS